MTDELKDMIAAWALGGAEEAMKRRIQEVGGTVEIIPISQLQTQVRVKTSPDVAPRYFLVKVSEQL